MTPVPTLFGMPLHILENIIEKMRWDVRMRFRRCSKYCNEVALNTNCFWTYILLMEDDDGFELELKYGHTEFKIVYTVESVNEQLQCRKVVKHSGVADRNANEEREETVVSDVTNFIETAYDLKDVVLADFALVFKNCTKWNMKKLEIGGVIWDETILDNEYYMNLGVILFSSKRKISVEKLTISGKLNEYRIMQILPIVKPRTLQQIDISNYDDDDQLILNQLKETVQWNQAECVSLSGVYTLEYSDFTQFKFVRFDWPNLDVDNLKRFIKETEDRKDQFQSLIVSSTDHNEEEIQQYLRNNFGQLCENPLYYYKKHPHLDCFLRFRFEVGTLIDSTFEISRVLPVTFELIDDRFPYFFTD